MMGSAVFPGGYYQNAFEVPGESEGSGSPGQIDTEVTASENSSAPTRKCIRLNSTNDDPYGVPRQVISSNNMSLSERKDLIHRLKLELEQIKSVLKKADLQRLNTASLSSTSDWVGSSTVQQPSQVSSFKKSSKHATGPEKKVMPHGGNLRGWNRGSSGKFESAKQSLTSTATEALMKQCVSLLKKLLSHPHAWVFKEPVDAVKLNIPDYFTIIKHPMDLGTVRKNLTSGVYSSPLEFAADVRLTFTNAMTYNPPGHDVHIMADILSKVFESRWKTVEKKLPAVVSQPFPTTIQELHKDRNVAKSLPPAKKRKTASPVRESAVEPVKHAVTEEERHCLGRQLETLLDEIPAHIIDFLKKHSSNGTETGEDEIEIDIDVLSDEVLLTLQKLLNEYLREKEKKHSAIEPCEIELLNGSVPSNSSVQQGNELADEYIGGNEPPVSGSSSDSDSSSSDDESEDTKAMNQATMSKMPETENSEAQRDEKTRIDPTVERNQPPNGMDRMDSSLQQKLSSDDSECHHDGNLLERQVSSEKLYRAALLKNRFADIILKAREKTLLQNDVKGDPERQQKEREELELQKKKERARLQAEAKAAEDARRQAEAVAAAEAKRQREIDREAARQALLKMEKTVEINENSRFLEDLEMLSSVPPEQLPSLADKTSPERPLEGLGSFKLSGSNPLEQLGLYMKQDDEEEEPDAPTALSLANSMEEPDAPTAPSLANHVEEEPDAPTAPSLTDDVEEGEID